MSPTTLEAWLGTHPYLRPVGLLCAEVEAAAAASAAAPARVPDWEDYAADFRAGVPLLRSLDAGIDLDAGGRAVLALVERLAANPAGGKVAADVSTLRDDCARRPRRAASWTFSSARRRSRRPPRVFSVTSAGPRWRGTSVPW